MVPGNARDINRIMVAGRAVPAHDHGIGKTMAFATITLERADRVGVITLNRPERLNAIDRRMLEELGAALDDLESDAEVRAIVLTGAGKAFSSGFDLKEQMAARPEGPTIWREILARDFNAVMRFWHCP